MRKTEKKRRSEGVGHQKSVLGPGVTCNETDARDIVEKMPLNGIEPPPHTGDQITGPALADKRRGKAACLQETQSGHTHTTVADVIGEAA